jgi:hypothetical protein
MTQSLEASPQDKSAAADRTAEAKSEQSRVKVGQLTDTSTLGNVDHKTFTEAQHAHSGDNGKSHLPDVAVPVALDKGVIAEHKSLASLAENQLKTTEDKAKFLASMDQFERRADSQHLTPEQITASYKQVEKMLGPSADSPFSPTQRQELSSQWMNRLGDPSSSRQGWHDDCNWNYLEHRLLSKDPDKISKKMAEVITTGGVTTLDWKKAQIEFAKGGADNSLPTKHLAIDPASLKPDQEAQGVSPHADRREYVDQIAQVMEGNIDWDSKTRTPTGESVPYGTMHYDQAPTVKRPSDPSPDGQPADKSGESVSYVDPKTGQRIKYDDHGYGFGGGSSTTDVALVNGVITGRQEQIALLAQKPGVPIDGNSAIAINSLSALKSSLANLQKSGGFPMGAIVSINESGVIEDYLARHPEKTAATVSKLGSHVLSITGLDASGNVEVFNPWGVKRTLTPAQLFQAMTGAK